MSDSGQHRRTAARAALLSTSPGAGRGGASGTGRSALAALGAAEQGAVLEGLLRSRPELGAAAERIAREQLEDADHEAVAEEVEWELRSLSADELNGRAGRQPRGYVDPTEAAWELLGEAVEPYDREFERLIALDMTGPATETALGVIAGLYRCRGCDDGEMLLSWAPDFPLDRAAGVAGELGKARLEVPPERVADAAPEWAASLAPRGARRP